MHVQYEHLSFVVFPVAPRQALLSVTLCCSQLCSSQMVYLQGTIEIRALRGYQVVHPVHHLQLSAKIRLMVQAHVPEQLPSKGVRWWCETDGAASAEHLQGAL